MTSPDAVPGLDTPDRRRGPDTRRLPAARRSPHRPQDRPVLPDQARRRGHLPGAGPDRRPRRRDPPRCRGEGRRTDARRDRLRLRLRPLRSLRRAVLRDHPHRPTGLPHRARASRSEGPGPARSLTRRVRPTRSTASPPAPTPASAFQAAPHCLPQSRGSSDATSPHRGPAKLQTHGGASGPGLDWIVTAQPLPAEWQRRTRRQWQPPSSASCRAGTSTMKHHEQCDLVQASRRPRVS